MTHTSQQWPVLAQPAASPADTFANPAEPHGFVVFIEEISGQGESQRWAIRNDPQQVPGTRSEAQQAALNLARSYSPQHPMMEQGREVYQVSPDSYLTIVQGMTSSFHFRVTVAQPLA